MTPSERSDWYAVPAGIPIAAPSAVVTESGSFASFSVEIAIAEA
ncbi:MAG: hypothetical protein K0R99_1291 [Microbacterium sp.]|nr:hypothetical protein [Microbacterium sp.]